MKIISKDYKNFIYQELDKIPEDIYPMLYNIIKNLSKEYSSKKDKKKSKLKGLWGKIEISNEIINEAKNSLFKMQLLYLNI